MQESPKPEYDSAPPLYRGEYDAFAHYIEGKPIPPGLALKLILKAPLAVIEWLIRYIPGAIGFKLRYYYYKLFLKSLGKNVLIDVGVFLSGPRNISIGDYVWIDANCILSAYLGEISIGRRVHIAPFSIIGARAPVVIEDYVGISAGVKIYSNSEHPADGKRMSGPMVSEKDKAFRSAPVTLRKDSFVGANAVILPGVEIGQGAVVGANSVISKPVPAWKIVVGTGKIVGDRQQVTVADQ